ncbi:pitrilysin family protein [Prevotella sp. KH2C16]|uniref:M16 family metallopeptidase n=1 Tax=Prevotella sp. KH2C16 TaxID=1855325 RepID=UPI0008E839F3|nr:M16 family metallopeptidase [Prevotella sp. KH2C16]SFG43585.1 Predicted Zn-dependent peptidase [Prevotella sp. KH2C16]
MKSRFFLASLLLAFGLTATQAKDYKYTTVKGDPMQTRIYTLDNGLKVYLSVNKEKPRIQTYIAVRTGSRNDPAETTGLAHYLEHLMFKGTNHFGTSDYQAELPFLNEIEQRYEAYRKLTDPQARKQAYHEIDSVSGLAARYNIPNEYDKLMSGIGSEGSNAYTSNDVTCYVENIPANEVDNWAKVEADRFQNMVIRGFHTELEAVYEEYNIGLAQDSRKMFQALTAKLFPTHPYGTQSTIGRGEHLKNPSITNIKNYFRRYYVPNNVAICMAGDLNPDEVIATIDRYFGSWKKSETLSRPEYAPLAPITAPQDTSVVGQEAESLYMAWRFPAGKELTSDTLDILGSLLNNGRAGLMDLDLSQKMKVQEAFAGSEAMCDYSIFLVGGAPKQGQTLEEVRALLLEEVGKLKRGEFSDELLPSVINNYKRDFYKGLDNNRTRASQFVDAFINGEDWEQHVGRLDRFSKMTKAELVAFADKYLNDNFVCVYKRQGNDTTLKKVDKPAITPIPTNNDKHSAFLLEIQASKPAPIQPQFLDFDKDLTTATTEKGLPVVYRQNTTDDLFTLQFRYPLGTETNPLVGYAASYLEYLGTDKFTSEQIKQKFYRLACDYSFDQRADQFIVSLSGLNENLPEALRLLEHLMQNAKPDKQAYTQYVDLVLKGRADNKTNQRSNFQALMEYGIHGEYNSTRNIPSEQKLREGSPEELTDLMEDLSNHDQTVLYYGPSTLKTLSTLISKEHPTLKTFLKADAARPYVAQTTPRNEVWIAPYDAKNIYMTQLHNENREYTPERRAIIDLFNEYFGGGMNAIVFQELREARGLAYSASARYSLPSRKQDKEFFYTNIITQNDKMMDCIKEFNELLNNTPEREAGFSLAKQSLLKNLASARTTKFGILNAYMYALRLGIDYDPYKKEYEMLPKLTLKDLMDFARENIQGKTYKYIILGDEKNLDMKALEKIGPVRRLTTEEIFGY